MKEISVTGTYPKLCFAVFCTWSHRKFYFWDKNLGWSKILLLHSRTENRIKIYFLKKICFSFLSRTWYLVTSLGAAELCSRFDKTEQKWKLKAGVFGHIGLMPFSPLLFPLLSLFSLLAPLPSSSFSSTSFFQVFPLPLPFSHVLFLSSFSPLPPFPLLSPLTWVCSPSLTALAQVCVSFPFLDYTWQKIAVIFQYFLLNTKETQEQGILRHEKCSAYKV